MKNINIYSNFLEKIILKNISKNLKTRFAPESNGYLHIGHLKNIINNLEISNIYNGFFFFRIDDTNPKNNKKTYYKYIKNILILLKKFYNKKFIKKFSSFYFNKLYQYSEILIKKNFFYIYNKKKKKKYSLKEFRSLKKGLYKEKENIVKLNIHKDFNYKKLISWRILYNKHYILKYNWYIFPSYDFSNILIDKIENIKFSICTNEFTLNRKIYKFLNYLIYFKIKPIQIEFSKFKINNSLTSKRKIKFIKKNKYIKSYKDKRLYNIFSLIKKGYNISSLFFLCKKIGISKINNFLDKIHFNKIIKKNIKFKDNLTLIIKSITIILENINKNYIKYIKFIKNNNYTNLNFSKNILINFFLLFKKLKIIYVLKNFNKFIKLKYLDFILCNKYLKNKFGYIKNILCKYYKKKILKKTNSDWLSKINYIKIKILIFNEILNKNKNIENKKSINIKSKKKIIAKLQNNNSNIVNSNLYYYFKDYGILIFKKIIKNTKILIIKESSTLHDSNM